MKRINKKLAMSTLIILALSMLWIQTVSAHKIPADCLGSGLGINLYTNVQSAYIGNAISYTVDVFNGTGSGPIVCNVSNIQAYIVTPDGQSHPISLLRTSLLNGEIDTYPNVVTYTARAQDVKAGNILTATASDTGDIHQNDTDSQGGGNHGVNVEVLTALAPSQTPTETPMSAGPPNAPTTPTTPTSPTTPSQIPPTTSGGGGGGGGNSVPLVSPTIIVSPSITVPIIPNLPNTGLPFQERNTLWNITILISIFTLISTLLVTNLIRK